MLNSAAKSVCVCVCVWVGGWLFRPTVRVSSWWFLARSQVTIHRVITVAEGSIEFQTEGKGLLKTKKVR